MKNILNNNVLVSNKTNNKILVFIKQWQLHIMILPALALLIIFMYLPMWGILLAFKDYDIFAGFITSDWVGFKHFVEFFTSSEFWRIMRNTIAISSIKLAVGFPAPIILALLINEVGKSTIRRTYQTISYLPHFVSWVIVAGLVTSLLSVDNGSVNTLLTGTGLIENPINWLSRPEYFWGILVSADVWKSVGFGSIIYLAAIAGINPELYDAASVDGASHLQKIFKITIPSISSVIVILLILRISRLLSAGFMQILLLTNMGRNTILRPVSDTIGTYVYRTGIENMRFSYATAAGVFQAVVSVSLLILANYLSKKITDDSLW